MIGWGEGTKRRAGLILLLTGGVVVVSLALMWCDSEARARTQGNWCERTGRTYNANGDVVRSGRWSNDGGESWND